MIHLKLNLKPQAKQRPRFNRRSGKVYTESETYHFERQVRALAKDHISEPLGGVLRLIVLFVYPHLKKDGNVRPERKYKITRPDLSNLIKSFEDGLQSVAFNDDAQIVSCTTEKIHGAVDEEPHIEFTLEELTSYQDDSSTSCTLNAYGETLERERETVSSPQPLSSYSDIENVIDGICITHRETLERVCELESLNRVRTPRERQELKDKRRVLNQAKHRAQQEARHKKLEIERGSRKLSESRRKLDETNQRRASIKDAEELVRRRESEAYFNRLTVGLIKRPLISPDNEDFDDEG